MAKEIEAIERVTSPGDLPQRLEAAENATVDVEKKLAKTVRAFILIQTYLLCWFFIFTNIFIEITIFSEWFASRTGRRMGEMREET